MKKIFLILAILASTFTYGQNEWLDNSSPTQLSPNNINTNMYRTANVAIGAAFTAPTTIPFAVEDNTAGGTGTKCAIGGKVMNGSFGTSNSVLEIQSNVSSSASILNLTSGASPNFNYFIFAADPSYGESGIYSTKAGSATALPITLWTYGSSLYERMRLETNGNVGIGTSSPLATLHVETNSTTGVDGSVVFVGPSSSSGAAPPVTGAGNRMMWYPDLSSFRVGTAVGAEWDSGNTGLYSFASNYATTASGDYSFAANSYTIASGTKSAAFNNAATASGNYSFAANSSTTAYGTGAASFNEETQATGTSSFSTGAKSVASGAVSFVSNLGTTASGNNTTCMGESTTAQAFDELVIGRDNCVKGNPTQWTGENPIFQIGIGDNAGNPADAMIVLKNGNVGLGIKCNSSPAYQLELSTNSAAKPGSTVWTVPSDSRLKTDISDYKKGLHELKKIHPVNFKYNGLFGIPTNEEYVGIIAQEIKDVLPNTVGKQHFGNDKDEYYNFNANELIYLLVNSVKEVASENDQLKTEVKNIRNELEEVKTRLNEIESRFSNVISVNPNATQTNHNSYLKSIDPNPFNDKTVIGFALPENITTALIIINDARGNIIKSYEVSKSSNGQITIDGKTLTAGTYFCNLWIDGRKADSKTFILTK